MIFRNFLDEDYEYPRCRRNSYRDRYLNEDDELDYQTSVEVFNDFKESLWSDLESRSNVSMLTDLRYLENVYDNLVNEYRRVLKKKRLPGDIKNYFRVDVFRDKFIDNMSMYKPVNVRAAVAKAVNVTKDSIDDSVVTSLVKSGIKSFLDTVDPKKYVKK